MVDKKFLLETIKRLKCRKSLAVALGISYNNLTRQLCGYQKMSAETESKIVKYIQFIDERK